MLGLLSLLTIVSLGFRRSVLLCHSLGLVVQLYLLRATHSPINMVSVCSLCNRAPLSLLHIEMLVIGHSPQRTFLSLNIRSSTSNWNIDELFEKLSTIRIS